MATVCDTVLVDTRDASWFMSCCLASEANATVLERVVEEWYEKSDT